MTPAKFRPFWSLGDPFLVVPNGRVPWSFSHRHQLSDLKGGVNTHPFMSVINRNPKKHHEKAFAYSVGSAGSDKLNNFVCQIQNYDYLIICDPIS